MPRFIESLSRNLKSKFSSKWFFHTAPFLITSESNFDVMIWSHPIETYWNNYWKWDWKVPGQVFWFSTCWLLDRYILWDLTLEVHDPLQHVLRRQHGEKCRWKTCFQRGETTNTQIKSSRKVEERKLWSWHCSSCPATSEVCWGCVVINRKRELQKLSWFYVLVYDWLKKPSHSRKKCHFSTRGHDNFAQMLLSLPTEVWEPSLQQGLPSENLIQGTR